MQLQQLEYIIKTADCGSITRAAQELYLSQPSLTRAIMNFESEYDIQIFSRSSKGIELTPEGKEFIYFAKNTMASVNALEKLLRKRKTQADERVVLSVASQQFDFLYTALLDTYFELQSLPMHLNIMESNRSAIITSVLDADVNLGLIVHSKKDSKMFRSMLDTKMLEIDILDTSNVFLNVGNKSVHYNKKYVTMNEIKNDLTIVLDIEEEVTKNLCGQFHFLQNNQIIFFNNINACIKFLIETDANLFTPKWLLQYFNQTSIHSIPVINEKGESEISNELICIKRVHEPLNTVETIFLNNINKALRTSAPC